MNFEEFIAEAYTDNKDLADTIYKNFENYTFNGAQPPLILTKCPEFINRYTPLVSTESSKFEGYKSDIIYFDELNYTKNKRRYGKDILCKETEKYIHKLLHNKYSINRNHIAIDKQLYFNKVIEYEKELIVKINSLLIDSNWREFYCTISALMLNRLYYKKEFYILRFTNIEEIPYIITDDIRLILYSYIPYRFKKEDIKPFKFMEKRNLMSKYGEFRRKKGS